MITKLINRSTFYITGIIAEIGGAAFRTANDALHEVKTISKTVVYDVSRRGLVLSVFTALEAIICSRSYVSLSGAGQSQDFDRGPQVLPEWFA